MKFKISFLTQWGNAFGAKDVSVRVYVENFQLNHSIGNSSRLPLYLGSKSISIRGLRLISDTYEV